MLAITVEVTECCVEVLEVKNVGISPKLTEMSYIPLEEIHYVVLV